MLFRSLHCKSLVTLAALLVACGSDDKPAVDGHGGSAAGGDNAAGGPDNLGSSGTSTEGGSSSDAGATSGGKGQASAGMPSEGGSGDGGQASSGNVNPPALEGDRISWTWSGYTYTAKKQIHAGWYNAGANVNIAASDTDDSVPPNTFTLHLMPNMVGTFKCSDYVTALDSSFGIVWQTFDQTATPPNPGFSYDPSLPCEFTITRADKGDTAGDVFEGTFKATLRYPGNGVYTKQDRADIAGTMRLTKK